MLLRLPANAADPTAQYTHTSISAIAPSALQTKITACRSCLRASSRSFDWCGDRICRARHREPTNRRNSCRRRRQAQGAVLRFSSSIPSRLVSGSRNIKRNTTSKPVYWSDASLSNIVGRKNRMQANLVGYISRVFSRLWRVIGVGYINHVH